MKAVSPDLVSWDHYAMTQHGDRPGFFDNLSSIERNTQTPSGGTPFWQIILSVQHLDYRALTENELRFEAMQSLVYGASGLTYFTYVPPDDATAKWNHAIAEKDGKPGALYDAAKNVNKQVSVLAKYLYGSLWVETFQTGKLAPDGKPAAPDDTIRASGGDLSIGVFRGGGGYLYTLVTNRNYTEATKADMVINLGKRDVEQLDITTNKWTIISTKRDPEGNTLFSLSLAPAGASLVRWK
jgi:hypothetical protein